MDCLSVGFVLSLQETIREDPLYQLNVIGPVEKYLDVDHAIIPSLDHYGRSKMGVLGDSEVDQNPISETGTH